MLINDKCIGNHPICMDEKGVVAYLNTCLAEIKFLIIKE